MSDISLSDAFLEQSPACHWIVDRSGVFQRIYGDPAPVFGPSVRLDIEARPDSGAASHVRAR